MVLRPLALSVSVNWGYTRPIITVNGCIAVWPWGAYLGDEGLRNGIRAKGLVIYPPPRQVMMTKSKATGN